MSSATSNESSRANPLKPLLILVPLLIIGVLAAAFLYGRSNTDGSGTAVSEEEGVTTPRDAGSETAQARGNLPVLRIDGEDAMDQIGPKNLASLANKVVEGENMRVLEQVNETTYWVGSDEEHKVLLSVATNSPQANPRDFGGDMNGVDTNTLVQFRGTFRGLQDSADEFNLENEADSELLRTQAVYIYAEIFDIDG
jgi:hypothetical protein